MRIGVLGVGRIGSFHANTLRDLATVDTVVVADADADRARDVAARLGVETAVQGAGRAAPADPLDDLLSARIDALVIAASTAEHPRLIRRGVDAGLPVFCEKPVAPTSAETLEVVKYADGAEVQIGFQRRFDLGIRAARQAAQSGALGWVHTIRATTLTRRRPRLATCPVRAGSSVTARSTILT
jgi:myo-inositol 2-dehydrogenase / D-chiro-inositol 1-dehydrogenase